MLKEIELTPPQLQQKFDTLTSLVSTGNGIHVYAAMYQVIWELVAHIPLQFVAPSGITHLCRSRYNEQDVPITTEQELYYPPVHRITTIGRANLPHQQMFYASAGFRGHTDEQFDPHYGSVLECDKNIFTDGVNETTRHYTTGLYTIHPSDMPFIILPFCSSGSINHPQMKEAQGYFIEMVSQYYTEKSISEIIIPFQQFISECFSRPLEHENEYVLSVAITNVILQYYEAGGRTMGGILFSSATSQSRSVNAAIVPAYADRFLTLQKVIQHRCRSVGKERFIEPCSEIIDVIAQKRFTFVPKEWPVET